jgi:DNA repair protein SbcD/Mre11
MRVLHTADWHLGDRLGRIDRTDDLRAAVERVFAHCEQEAADVLLVAGDLFSELARPDNLRDTVRHWQQVFAPFFARGGTVLTLTGNHDSETFCQTLRHAMTLAAPVAGTPGELVPPGRLYLAAEPTLLRLRAPAGTFDVQFALMPYPTPTRYLKGEAGQRYAGPEEKNALLVAAFEQALRAMPVAADAPAVLAAHAHVRGANVGPGLFRLTAEEDVLIDGTALADRFAYVALGHIHKPQSLAGHAHVRYSGSIEKMDLGEAADTKGVVVFDLTAAGLAGDPRTLPLPSTPVYEVHVTDPAADLPRLAGEYAGGSADLVNLHVRYTPGVDDLEAVLKQLEGLFPRWYARDWQATTDLGPTLVGDDAARGKGFAETVREYLGLELAHHPDDERAELLARAEELLREVED